jgi:hypothetical protein
VFAVVLLLLVAALAVLSIAWVAVSVPHVREDQIRRGLFGEPPREGLIADSVVAIVDLAERQVRLAHFGSSLRARMWEGTIAHIAHPHPGGSTIWRFASGDVWQVELARATPRSARRVVVRSVEQRGSDLRVDVYVPGRLDLSLSVVDVRAATDVD